jgi:hypothetical protein
LVNVCEKELSKSLELSNAISILESAVRVRAEDLRSFALTFIADNHKSLQKTPEWKKVIEPDSDLLNEILKLKH